jgi:hypothetical protein
MRSISTIYAGEGNLVKRDSTVLIGNYYEYTNGSAKKFYYAGGVRIAVRPADGVARWLLSDHSSRTQGWPQLHGKDSQSGWRKPESGTPVFSHGKM